MVNFDTLQIRAFSGFKDFWRSGPFLRGECSFPSEENHMTDVPVTTQSKPFEKCGGPPPYKYRPEFCEKVLELGKKGYSIYAIAQHFEVAVRTLFLWATKEDDWFNAFLRARDYSKAWLVQKMIDGLENPEFHTRLAQLLAKFVYHAVDGELVRIPQLKDAKTPREQGNLVIDAMAVGHITTTQAERVMKVVLQCATAVEKTEIRDRLELLEQRLDS